MSEPLADRQNLLFRSLLERTDELQQILETGFNKKIDNLVCQSPTSWNILEIPEVFNGRGLTFVLFASEGGYLAFLPETQGALPRNYGAIAADPSSKYVQLANRLQELLLPDEANAPAAQVGKIKVFSSVARRTGIDSEATVVPLNYSCDGRSVSLWFVGKAPAPELAFSKGESERNRRSKSGFANSFLSGLTDLSRLSRDDSDIRFETSPESDGKFMRRDDEHSEIAVQERDKDESAKQSLSQNTNRFADGCAENQPVRGAYQLADASVLRSLKKNLPQVSQSVLSNKSINGKMEKVNRNSNSLLTQGDKHETQKITGKDQLRQEKEEQVVQTVQESYGQVVQKGQSAKTGEGSKEAQKSQIEPIKDNIASSLGVLASCLPEEVIPDNSLNSIVKLNDSIELCEPVFESPNGMSGENNSVETSGSDGKTLESYVSELIEQNENFADQELNFSSEESLGLSPSSEDNASEKQASENSLDSQTNTSRPLQEINSLIQTLQAISEPELVVSEPVDSELVDSDLVVSEPVDSELVDSELVDSEPVDSESVDSELVDSKLVDSKLVDSKLVDSKLVDSKLADSKLVDSESVDSEPVDSESVDSESVDSESVDSESVDSESVDSESVDSESVDLELADSELADLEPADLEPVDLEPVDLEPVDLESVDLESVDSESVDSESVDSESVDSEPADLEPADLEPADLEPVDLEPADLEPADLEPVDLELADSELADLEPADLEPVDLELADSEPVDLELADLEPADSEPVDCVETKPEVHINHPILSLKVRAEAVVANQRFFLGDILNWRPGQVLEFDDLSGQVELTVGHRPLASGWAVETAGKLGVLVEAR